MGHELVCQSCGATVGPGGSRSGADDRLARAVSVDVDVDADGG